VTESRHNKFVTLELKVVGPAGAVDDSLEVIDVSLKVVGFIFRLTHNICVVAVCIFFFEDGGK